MRVLRGLLAGARSGERRTACLLALVAGAALPLAACSAEAADPAGTTRAVASSPPVPTNVATSPTTSSAAPAGSVSRSVSVTGRTVTPPPGTVELAVGQTMEVTVTVDHDDVLHAHGFEVERDVTAGEPTTITLTATTPGVYEVELHNPSLVLFEVAVR